MSIIEGIYEEIMADLVSKGFGGLVSQIDHDYKNASMTTPNSVVDDKYTYPKTKNETPAGFYLRPAGSPSNNYDDDISLILNKSPGLNPGQLQKVLREMYPKDTNIKHKVSESLRRLKERHLIDYDQYFKFYPVQVLS